MELQPRDGARMLFKGTADLVDSARAAFDGLLAEAAKNAVDLPLTRVQLDKLGRAAPHSRDREPLSSKLQSQFECAVVVDRAAMTLSLRGRAEAMVRLQAFLDVQLDVDEHVRDVPGQSLSLIIGKGGVNIKRLQSESGAVFDLDKISGRVRIHGTNAAVQKAVQLLDELLEQFGSNVEIRLQPRQVPLIIGRAGATIKALQAESGASIVVSKEELLVRLRGSKSAIDAAKQRIQALLQDSHPSAAGPPARSAAGPPPGLRLPQRQPAE